MAHPSWHRLRGPSSALEVRGAWKHPPAHCRAWSLSQDADPRDCLSCLSPFPWWLCQNKIIAPEGHSLLNAQSHQPAGNTPCQTSAASPCSRKTQALQSERL